MIEKKKAEIEFPLINEKGNPKWLPNEFYYNEIKLKGYRLQDRSGEPGLFVEYGRVSDLEAATKRITCKNSELLIKILNLKVALPATLFESPVSLAFSQSYEEKVVEKIKNWCERNGFPFKPDVQEGERKAKTFFDAPGYISFRISDFVLRLSDLYSSFLLYQMVTGQKNQIDSKAYISKDIKGKITHDSFISLKDISKDEAKKILENKYKEIIFTNTLSLKDGLHWEIQAADLFDAALYQLILLLNGYGREIKICPLCNNPFEPTHGRQKYCKTGTCYKELAYKKNKRAEKKRLSP